MSYHSDLDLMLVYEGDGRTAPPPGATRFDRFELTDNFHFFTELAQRIIQATSYLGPMGRLYQVDMRLRPTGKSGSLVLPLAEFRRYFAATGGRPALGAAGADAGARGLRRRGVRPARSWRPWRTAAYGLPWRPELADEIRDMRERLEASRSDRDLKRGFGGIVDVEFLVQLFQLKYGRDLPALRTPNTWEALDALRDAGLLTAEEHAALRAGYDFLRLVREPAADRPQPLAGRAAGGSRRTWRSWPAGWASKPRRGRVPAASSWRSWSGTRRRSATLFLSLIQRERDGQPALAATAEVVKQPVEGNLLTTADSSRG